MQPLTVSQLVDQINSALNALEGITVEGEVDEFKIIHGKWVVFKLKDEQSSIDCFMTLWQYKTQIEDGMLVRAIGRPTLRNKGFLSFVLTSVQPSGEGALKRAFELLKQKLTEEGLFAPDRKRSLPRFPQHIALITSRDAAAYSDFLKVLQARYGGLTISFVHTQVQGEDAPRQLVQALNYANTELKDLDVIVLIRGGGSLEDLQAFNDETVVRTVSASRTPTIVGIGHERDTCLAELAADIRASTPSNAAELLIRSRDEIELGIKNLRFALSAAIAAALQSHQNVISRSIASLRTRTAITQQRVNEKLRSLSALKERISHTISTTSTTLTNSRTSLTQKFHDEISRRIDSMEQLMRVLRSFSPTRTLERGYSITRTEAGQIVKSAKQLAVGDSLSVQVADGTIAGTVGPKAKQNTFNF